MANTNNCKKLITALQEIAVQSDVSYVSRFFWADPNGRSSDNRILGVRFGLIFKLAKQFIDMQLADIEKLLDNKYYEVRMAAVSIMDFQARAKRAPEEQRKALYDLYLRRHDRINNWDLVDRAAPFVVGGYLADKPRGELYDLARSENPWERRTAIVSTAFFIKQKDIKDTFGVAELMVNDSHELIQKAVGSWIREAGKVDQKKLINFLNSHAASMPRTMLRMAVEKLAPAARARYLN